ncbi:MAG TPA: hypothetical protein DFS52_02275 [Myxococcales bacterium]|jgi:predicted transposase YdaD|nr:hypothetical protein [Myxococcales bacterium]
MDSSTYRAMREEGRKEGREAGRKEELSKACRMLVKAKLGHLPPEAAAFESTLDIDTLSGVFDRLLEAPDPKAARSILRSLER